MSWNQRQTLPVNVEQDTDNPDLAAGNPANPLVLYST